MEAKKRLFSNEITEPYAKGQRMFRDAEIPFCQFGGMILDGITFRNCDFQYTSFRFTSIKNAKFIGCNFFFGSFYGADLENVAFENCNMEFLRLDDAAFSNTIFRKCDISYSTIMNTALGAAEFIDCKKFKVFGNINEITEHDVADAMKIIGPSLESLDYEIKNRIKNILEKIAKEYNMSNPMKQLNKGSAYSGNQTAGNAYEKMTEILDSAIQAYNAKNPYRTKTPYDS